MNIPSSIDPATITRLALNECYFNAEDLDPAYRMLEHLFPNADIDNMYFDDYPENPVMEIEANPGLSPEDKEALYQALEKGLPEGPFRDWDFDPVRCDEGPPKWKGKGPAPSTFADFVGRPNMYDDVEFSQAASD